MMDERINTSNRAPMMLGQSGVGRRPWTGFRFTGKFPAYGVGAALLASSLSGAAMAQGLVLEREGRVISLEPYAPNILRVTMSTDRAAATGAPGYGFVAQPSAEGWTHERDAGRLRCVPIRPDGGASGARGPSEGQAAAADATRCAES